MPYNVYTPEPNRLLLIWQSSMPELRTKFVVGELVRSLDRVSLTYSYYSDDLITAVQAGFNGHPAFPITTPVHHHNVIEIFGRRLPPRNRSDFQSYLSKYRIAPEAVLSDFALLGYTGGSLPGDGFSCAIDYRYETLPHMFLMEVAGFRYNQGMHVDISDLQEKLVYFIPEDSNAHDTNAVMIFTNDTKLGYVPRYYARLMRMWLHSATVLGVVEKIDGPLTKPQMYLIVSVGSKTVKPVNLSISGGENI